MKNYSLIFTFLIVVSFTFIHKGLNAQTINSRYKREMKKFMKYIRSSEFERYPVLKINDYLCNKDLFRGVILFGTGVYGLSNEEKFFLQKILQTDTTKYYINKHLMKNIQFVPDNQKKEAWILSKPIFLRSYLLCVFSFGSPYDPDFGQEWTYLYKKENGKWSKLLLMGKIDAY